MTLVDELQHAAAQAMDDASTAAHAFMPAYEALQAAAEQVGLAWAGAWVPHIGNLYQRALQPLTALPTAAAEGGNDAATEAPALPGGMTPGRSATRRRVPAAVMASCRVFTPQDVRDAIRQAAGHPDMAALQTVSMTAAAHVVQAACRVQVLLDRACAVPGCGETIAALRASAGQVRLADKTSLTAAWRAQQSRRASGAGGATVPRHNPFETVPAHIAELAALQALRSPIDGLLKLAGLLRQAAAHVDTTPVGHRPATVFPPQDHPCPLNNSL